MKEKIILTIQSTGTQGKFRFGIDPDTSNNIFKKRGVCVLLTLDDFTTCCKTTCGPPNKKGFDLYSKEISKWIINKKHNDYSFGIPKNFEFEIIKDNELFKLKLIGEVPNKKLGGINN